MASRSRFSKIRATTAEENSQRVMTQQSLLIPQIPNGEVDWNTLGNVLTAKIVGEVLCASYIDKKHRMARPQYAVDTDWKYAYEEKDVVILRKEFSDTPYHCWMGRTIIERPLRVIADFLEDPASAMIYDKHIMQSKHLAVLSESETQKDMIAYYFAETRECLVTAKRDFVFYLRHAYTDDKYVLTAMSVDYPLCPPVEGIPRAQIQPGSGWHLERHMGSNARTLVTYVAHTDLIALPPIIANRVLKRQPLNILYVKKHLLSRHQSSTSIPPPLSHTYNASVQCTQRSGHHLEEPLSIKAFTNQQTESMRRGEESCLSPSPSDTNSAQHSHTLGKREEHNDTPELSESS